MKTFFQILLLSLVGAAAAAGQTAVHLKTQAKSVDFSAASMTKPAKAGTILPAACAVGEVFFKTNATAGRNLYGCTATDTWSLQGDGGTGTLPSSGGNAHRLLSNNGTEPDWRLVGLGLLIDSMQLAVDTAVVPTLGDVNTFRGVNNFAGELSSAGSVSEVDFTGSGATRPVQTGATPPSNCYAREELFLDTDGGSLLICNATGDGWVAATGGGAVTGDVGLSVVIGDGVSTLSPGLAGYLEIPFGCTLSRWTVLADQTGSAQIDVWRDTYANFPPTDADSITASAPISISAARKGQDATLTGWNTTISADSILAFNVDSASTLTRVTVSLKCTR